jgi:hypothetical protein
MRFISKFTLSEDLKSALFCVESFSELCYVGFRPKVDPTDLYTGNYSARILKWGLRLWRKAYGNDDWESIMFVKNYQREWERKAKRGLIIAVDKSWIEQQKFVPISEGNVVAFSYLAYTRFNVRRGFVMTGK